jgi:hypothetical protein
MATPLVTVWATPDESMWHATPSCCHGSDRDSYDARLGALYYSNRATLCPHLQPRVDHAWKEYRSAQLKKAKPRRLRKPETRPKTLFETAMERFHNRRR